MALLSLLLFFIGVSFGSFFLVIIDRLPNFQSPWKGRSRCPHCSHVLAWYDLLPLVSYLLLQRKCRYCHTELSYYYPGLELTTGILFAFTPWFLSTGGMSFPAPLTVLYTLFILSTFIIVFFMDLKYGLIPFAVVIPASLPVFFFKVFTAPNEIISSILSAVCAGLFFYLIYFITRGRGMGFGDVVLVLYLGLVLGFPSIIIALYIAFLTGAGVSLILILSRRKKLKNSTIPFGPFLILGAYISYFWGEAVLVLLYRFLSV